MTRPTNRRRLAWRLPLLALGLVAGMAIGAGYSITSELSAVGDEPPAAPPIPTTPVPQEPPVFPLPGTPTNPPEPPPPPPAPAIDPELQALRERMQAAIDAYWVDGNFAVAITDLLTGHTVSVYGDRAQVAGCIWNLPVIIVAMQDVEAGRYPLERVEALIRQTLWASDASAAFRLYGIVGDGDHVAGVQRVLDLARELGLEQSIIDHPPAFVEYSLGISEPNLVTAEEVNEILAALYRNELLSPEWTQWLLEAMTRVKPGLNYLTAYGTGGVVSHKNGFLPDGGTWVDNDAGIVRFERNGVEHAYAITFLSEGVPTKYADIALGQQLSVMAWDYFNATYPAVTQAG